MVKTNKKKDLSSYISDILIYNEKSIFNKQFVKILILILFLISEFVFISVLEYKINRFIKVLDGDSIIKESFYYLNSVYVFIFFLITAKILDIRIEKTEFFLEYESEVKKKINFVQYVVGLSSILYFTLLVNLELGYLYLFYFNFLGNMFYDYIIVLLPNIILIICIIKMLELFYFLFKDSLFQGYYE